MVEKDFDWEKVNEVLEKAIHLIYGSGLKNIEIDALLGLLMKNDLVSQITPVISERLMAIMFNQVLQKNAEKVNNEKGTDKQTNSNIPDPYK